MLLQANSLLQDTRLFISGAHCGMYWHIQCFKNVHS